MVIVNVWTVIMEVKKENIKRSVWLGDNNDDNCNLQETLTCKNESVKRIVTILLVSLTLSLLLNAIT